MTFRFSLDNNVVFAIAVIAILVICIYTRLGLLQYQGLFEPDGFEYYTAIKQAVSQGFVLQNNIVDLSGYPWHNQFGEAPGLLYATLIPYALLQFFGISILEVMRFVSILFGIMTAGLCYFVVQYLSKSRVLGLLAMLAISLSSGNVARTAGGVYRGDSFVAVFTLLALALILMAFYEDKSSKRYALALGSGFLIGISNLVWNGGALTLAVYLAAVMMLFLYGFVSGNESVLKKNELALGALLLGYLLENLFVTIGSAYHITFYTWITPIDFALLFGSVFAANFIAVPLLKNKAFSLLLDSVLKRFVVLGALILVAGAVILIASPSTLNSIFSVGGVVANSNIGYTTQELQKPDLTFLEASFGVELILAPLGVLLFLLFAHKADSRTSKVTFKNGAFGINANYGFAIILAYLLFTSYLQSSAIRYNALVSVPMALFAAYALYIIGKMIQPYAFNMGKTPIPIVYGYAGFIAIILLYQGIMTASQSYSSVQADGINPQFLQAMLWLSNNTASNSTVLALWPDGSVVEGWGNRTSLMDSTFGENGIEIVAFARDFLFNTTPAVSYLENTAHRPDYILARSFWFAELGGIAIEGNITGTNLTNYGFDQFTGFSANGTYANQSYTFSSSNYRAVLNMHYVGNSTREVGAYLGLASGGPLTPFRHVLFVNSSSGTYSLLNYTGNNTANYTLFLSFDHQNITSAVLLGSALPETNFFKLLIECNSYQCAYNVPGSGVQIVPVYKNADSEILAVHYNSSV